MFDDAQDKFEDLIKQAQCRFKKNMENFQGLMNNRPQNTNNIGQMLQNLIDRIR